MNRAMCLAFTMSLAFGCVLHSMPTNAATKKTSPVQKVSSTAATKSKAAKSSVQATKTVTVKPQPTAATKQAKPVDPDSAKVLDPNLFAGQVKLGYELTKQQPSVARDLFCYCGCDVTDLHKTLLDCYTDPNRHAADCKHCIDEMLVANKMLKEGKTMAQVQVFLHAKIGVKEYPFSEPTVAYENYLKRTGLKFVRTPLAEPVASPASGEDGKGEEGKSGCCH